MPLPQGIANPNSAFGLPLTGTNIGGSLVMSNDGLYIEMSNNSAGTRSYGDVVITDVTGTLANTTTTANDEFVIGVVGQTGSFSSAITAIPVGDPILVQVRGVARVNIAANAVAARQQLASSAVAAVAAAVAAGTAVVTSGASAAANAGCLFAVALEANAAKDTNNTIRCKLSVGV